MKILKPTIESVESLYNSKEPTGDRILDEVVNCLRKTRIISAADLAILMDVKKSYLYGAMHILTGMALGDFINRWRLIQARELLRQGAEGEETDRVKRLEKTARRCGWRSYRVLLRVAKRYGFELEQ
jgi:AraC-like DNA-binding protein